MSQSTTHGRHFLEDILFSIASRVKKSYPRFMLLGVEPYHVIIICLQQYMTNARSLEAVVLALVISVVIVVLAARTRLPGTDHIKFKTNAFL